jgi:cell division ATPase FtsA
MPTRKELRTPQACQADPGSDKTAGVPITAAPVDGVRRRKRSKNSPEGKSLQAGELTETVIAPGLTSPLALFITNPGPESVAALAEAAKRNRRKRRVRMGEALRIKGIDEHAVAETFAGVVDMLKTKTEENDDVEKLLVDVLKECSKHLEEDSKATAAAPLQVKLIHNVARPRRDSAPVAPPSETSNSGANAAAERDDPLPV